MRKLETRRMVKAAVAACEDKKAERISILELDPSDSGFTDYFLICSGSSDRQNQAIATAIEDAMKRGFGTFPNSVEGYRQGEWILLDYVDFVVHIFSSEKRDFYDIERLRKTAAKVSVADLDASLVEKVSAARKKQAAKPEKKAAQPAKKKQPTSARKKAAGKKSAAVRPAVKKSTAKKSAPKKSQKKRPAR